MSTPVNPYRESTFLDSMRMQADPLADAFIDRLIQEEGEASVRELFERLTGSIDLPPSQLPESFKSFISEASAYPAWADPARIMRAEALFVDHGPLFLLLLYFRSLPTLYACANGAKVLARTGKLSHAGADRDVFSRRISETSQFLMNVMDEGGLRCYGPGLETILRVRLIHAAIRRWVSTEEWEEDQWGKPVNQEDLTITLMTFSISLLDGAKELGIAISAAEEEDFVHAWRVAGHFLGIDERLLPLSAEDGRNLLRMIFRRQAAWSAEGQQLAEALLDFSYTRMDGSRWEAAPGIILHRLGGEELFDLLGLKQERGCLMRMIPGFLAVFLRKTERAEELSARWADLSERLSRRLMQEMIGYFRPGKKIRMDIPRRMAMNWGIVMQEGGSEGSRPTERGG